MRTEPIHFIEEENIGEGLEAGVSLRPIHDYIVRLVQTYVAHQRAEHDRGMLRLTYTVMNDGRMTNVRAEQLEERPLTLLGGGLQWGLKALEARVAHFLEGKRVPLYRVLQGRHEVTIGRLQTFVQLNHLLH